MRCRHLLPCWAMPQRDGAGAATSTVRRVAQVLDVFLDGRADAGISEIARALGCSKSVVHRIAVSLSDAGYLVADPDTRRYRLGAKAIELGLCAVAKTEVIANAVDHLRRLADATGETATLNLLHGDVRVYAGQVEGREPVRQTVHVGQEVPLHLGAAGKAILAFLPEPRRQRVFWAGRGRANGARGTFAALERELAQVRRSGFAISHAELVAGAVSVAAPVFDRSGVAASIAVAGVSVRSQPKRLARYADVVRQEAGALSRKLGWSGFAGDVSERARASALRGKERGQGLANAIDAR